jgi:ammonia channel protein AmtB
MGVRASREDELVGLDVPEHGIEAYPQDAPPAVAGASRPGENP